MELLGNVTVYEVVPISDNFVIEDIMSFETRQMFEIVNYVFLSSLIAFFGVGTNSVNIVVFYKQGFQNTTTISFIALAISDMCCLVTLQWFNFCVNPLLANSNIWFVPLEIHALPGGWPHITFGRITGWITAFITAERCLCITAPLKVKRIITPRRTTCTLIGIYIVNISTILPVYSTCYYGWKFYPEKNRTLLGLLVLSNNEEAEGLVFFFHATFVLISFLCVFLLTTVLVIKLNGASKWRRQAARDDNKLESVTQKDKKTTRMVVMISSLLIIMYSPGIIFSLVSVFEPRFGIFGAYRNLFQAAWSFGFVCNTINSSVNIFMYYNMSSKYREIFRQIFLTHRHGNKRRSSLIIT